MITGKITTYKTEPTTYKYEHQSSWYGEETYFNSMPPYYKQADILNECIKDAYQNGFVIGAQVRRKLPISSQNKGTITHIHEVFGMAWNYTTGVLEPIRVQWDDKENLAKCFDYNPEELILIKNESNQGIIPNVENVSYLHQSC